MSEDINEMKNNQKDFSSQMNESEENPGNFINFIPNNEHEIEDVKTPEMSFNLNDNNYDKYSKEKIDEKDKEENTSKMTETKISSLKGTNQIDIIIYIANITVTVNLNCKLNLKKIVNKTLNSEYNPKKHNSLRMQLKDLKSHAIIHSSGKMICTGLNSEEKLQKAIIEYDKIIKNCGFSTKLNLEEIVISNITASCDVKFLLPLKKLYYYLANLKETGVKLYYFDNNFPSLNYYKKVDNSNIKLSFFTTGKINISGARKKEDISNIFNHIYPELLKFKESIK